MKKKHIYSITLLLFSLLSAFQTSNKIVPYLFGGKTLEGRNLIIQMFLLIGVSFVFFVAYFLLSKIIWLVIIKIWQFIFQNEKIIKTIATTKKSIQRMDESPWFRRVLFIIVILIGIVFLFVHIKIIFFPYPMELREGAQQLTTHALLNGINPYSLEKNPIYTNVYGIFYNLLVLPFSKIFGNSLSLYRLINGFCILGQILLLVWVFRIQKNDWLAVIIAMLLMWLAQIFYVTPLARPDTFGGLLFLMTLFVPFIFSFSNQSLFFSIIFGILSFYTKVFFFLGVIIIAAYLFLFISKRKAILYTFSVMLVLIVSAVIINKFLTAYFVNIIYPLFTNRIKNDYGRLYSQSVKFIRDYWGLLLVGLFALFEIFKKIKKKDDYLLNFDLMKIDSPMISPKMDFMLFCLLVSSMLVLLLLGKHSGTTMTYFYQLMTPFLLMVIFGWVNRIKTNKNWMHLILVLTLITQSYENLKPDFSTFKNSDWQKLDQRITKADQILNSPLDVSLLLDHGKQVAMSGLTEYYFTYPSQPFFLYADAEQMRLEGNLYISRIVEKITSKKYDFLETFQVQGTSVFTIGARLDSTLSDEQFISQYYHLSEILDFNMPHTYQEWEIGIWMPN